MNKKLPIVFRTIEPEDIANCKMLSDAEGWNQTETDWKLLVNNSQNICLLAESGRKVIGTATAMNYSGEVAWIGMVLVEKAYRGRGIGKMLLSNLLNRLNSFKSVKLDATPAGQPLYEKLGFKNEYHIHRMTTPSMNNAQPFLSGITPEPVLISDIPEITVLDASIFGVERITLVSSLINENPENSWCIKRNGRITAFALGRQGRKYHQIGPVFASSLMETIILISQTLLKLAGKPLVLDVSTEKVELINWLNSIGFVRQRDFVRMYLNENLCPGKPENQFLICGPEFG
jgi:ribosomal protein S18 acetylase RimI-like enzyme